jgi:hypothetical protein
MKFYLLLVKGAPIQNEFQTLTEPFCTGSYSSVQVDHDSVILSQDHDSVTELPVYFSE